MRHSIFSRQEGLIIRYPRRGAFVRGLTRRETEEIYSLRSVLEGFALELAIERMSTADIEHLRGLVRQMREVSASGDAVAFGQLDAEFSRIHLQKSRITGSCSTCSVHSIPVPPST